MYACSVLSLTVGQSLRAQPAAPPQPAGSEQVFQEGDDQGAAAPANVELKIVAAIACTDYNDLIKDVTIIGSLIGQPNIAQGIEGQVAAMTGGKGLAGVDKTKPWGLILQTDGMQFLPVVCLPVTNADDVLAAVAAIGADVKDGDGGVKQLSLPNGNSFFMKSAAGWSYLSKNAASLARLPSNPEAAFSKLLANYYFAAQAAVQNVPLMYRQFAILAVQSAMQQQLQRQPQESDEEFVARQKTLQTQMEQTVQQIQELDSITLGWLVDAPKKQSVLEFTYKFVPGGKMAKQFAAYGEPRTNFAGFSQADAAATLNFVTKADPQAMQAELAQFETMMTGARAQINKGIDESDSIPEGPARDAIKAAAGEFLDALAATLKSGQLDAAASLRVSPDSLTLVAGALVQDPGKFESGLKKLEEGFKESPSFPGIQWNADSHEGVRFHTMSIPLPAAEDGPAKLLGGKADVAFGIGPQAIYLAVGKDNLNAVKQAIDASKAEPNKLVPPFEVALSLGPFMEVAAAQAKDEAQRNKARAVADMLRAEAPGRDHVRIVGQVVPNGLRYRVEAEEGALRTIGKAAMEAQAQQQATASQGL
jgi:hypothetical protein